MHRELGGTREDEVCEHEPCNCVITHAMGDEGFCTPYCRTANAAEEEVNCACGHPQCDSP